MLQEIEGSFASRNGPWISALAGKRLTTPQEILKTELVNHSADC